MNSRVVLSVVAAAALMSFAACGGGSIGTMTNPTTYTISAAVTGLTGTLVLQDNGTDNLTVTADGTQPFATKINSGSAYAVTILTQPTGQTCSLGSNASGTAAANVTVAVTCSVTTYTISAAVSGLTGSGLVLQDNGGDDLTVTADGTVPFATPIATGGAYSVTIKSQPSGQTCLLGANASGTATANVTVTVTCTNIILYTISASVTGLTGTLVLQDNGGDNLSVTTNGTFPFATKIASGGAYAVTILTQPSGQTCTLGSNASGTATANTTVAVTCSATLFTISAAVSGLTGTGLVLQDNGGDNLSITANGTLPFATKIASGSPYAVTILTQPSGQTCTLGSNASGTATANTTVSVTCSATLFTISASVTGLTGTLVLQDNGADNLSITTNGTFPFATKIASGGAYAVTIFTQPSGLTCSLGSNASGTATSNVTVAVTCSSTLFTISASVTGLTGTLVLQDNGADNLSITTNGTFPFATKIANGGAYAVTIFTQPSGQTCTLGSNASGTATSNVTVSVTCGSTPTFIISAAVSGLTGTLVLQDNGADNLTITTNGTFPFATQIVSGGPYSVTVLTQPSGQICSLGSNSNGTATSNVTVAVTCVAGSGFTIGGTLYDLSTGGSTTGVVIQNNGGDNLTLNANGPFTFATPVASNGAYDVTVFQQPSGPEQVCTVNNGSGNATANVTNIQVVCISEWSWVAGANTVAQSGNYQKPGQFPGAREGASTWIDASGNLWLFGGFGLDKTVAESIMSDLWEFTGGAWKFVTGPQAEATGPTYPTAIGGSGTPGARAYAVSWIDSSGNLWMFGGYGLDVTNTSAGQMNDIWEFTGGQWIWQGGSQSQGQNGIYGTKGVGSTSNIPGARYWASGSQDASGNLWLFGGTDGLSGSFNDLWKFDPSTLEWTWVSGSNTFNQKATYGTQGTGSSSTVPGARVGTSVWIDSSGNFWLFAGDGLDGSGNTGELNDVWEFSQSKNQWIWKFGTNQLDQPGTYITEGVPDPTNNPGGRLWANVWETPSGDVWIFGGERLGGGLFADHWKLSNGQWSKMDGPDAVYQTGVFPASTGLGPLPDNAPGSRELGASWADASGNLWMFGGYGLASQAATFDVMNDLWEFLP